MDCVTCRIVLVVSTLALYKFIYLFAYLLQYNNRCCYGSLLHLQFTTVLT